MLKRTKEERDNDSLSRENEELRKLAFMDKDLAYIILPSTKRI